MIRFIKLTLKESKYLVSYYSDGLTGDISQAPVKEVLISGGWLLILDHYNTVLGVLRQYKELVKWLTDQHALPGLTGPPVFCDIPGFRLVSYKPDGEKERIKARYPGGVSADVWRNAMRNMGTPPTFDFIKFWENENT